MNATQHGGMTRIARGHPRSSKTGTSTTQRHEAAPINVGDPRAWVLEHREGRLGYQTGRGPRSVVVLYAVAADEILMRLPDYNDIVHYAPGERVTLEVAGAVTPSGDVETVTVTGTAHLLGSEQVHVDSDKVFVEPWPEGVRTSIIGLPLEDVRLIDPPGRCG